MLNIIPFKYKIKECLEKSSNPKYIQAKNILSRFLNVNKRAFEKYMYTYLPDEYEMPDKTICIACLLY